LSWDFRGKPPIDDAVEVVGYDPGWVERFQSERTRLLRVLAPEAVAIEHFGSSAVPGLAAKPVLGILAGVMPYPLPEDQVTALAALGDQYRGDGGVGRVQF
jgi:GrpB-like predicted nucleotidyltransferase (UPF0157 family)